MMLQIFIQPSISVGILKTSGLSVAIQPSISVGLLEARGPSLYNDADHTDKILVMQSFPAQEERESYFCKSIPTAVYVDKKLTRVEILGQTIKFYSLPKVGSEITVLFNDVFLDEGSFLLLHMHILQGQLIAGPGLELSLNNSIFTTSLEITSSGPVYLRSTVALETHKLVNKLLYLAIKPIQEITAGPFSIAFNTNKDATITVSGLAEGIEYYEV